MLIVVTVLIAIRFLIEAIFQKMMGSLLNNSMSDKGYGYEIYLVSSTLCTEVLAFAILTYTMY
jgi:hypothetical protein